MNEMNDAIHRLSVELAEMTRKHDEKAALLTAVTECAPELIWAKDTAGRYLFANRRHKAWLGVDASQDVCGMTDMDFAEINRTKKPDDPRYHDFGEMCQNSDEITLMNMKPMRFLEAGNVRGEYCALQVFKAPLYDAMGTLIGTVGSAIDVTDRIQTREGLYNKLMALIEQHGIRDPFRPLFEEFRAYCDRHKFSNGRE